jgi:hypothetical protein
LSPSPRPLKHLGLALALALLTFLLAVAFLTRPSFQNPTGLKQEGSTSAMAYPPNTLPLQVGIHVKNIYNLELERQTFSADGWY